jgi:hypothetical protein
MSSYKFVATFEITDRNMPMSRLQVEACRRLDSMAADAGGRIVGEPVWDVQGACLVALCEAEPLGDGPDPRLLVDEVAIRRAMAGERVHLTRTEQLVAIDRLAEKGHTAAEIARRLHTSYTNAKQKLAAVA